MWRYSFFSFLSLSISTLQLKCWSGEQCWNLLVPKLLIDDYKKMSELKINQ